MSEVFRPFICLFNTFRESTYHVCHKELNLVFNITNPPKCFFHNNQMDILPLCYFCVHYFCLVFSYCLFFQCRIFLLLLFFQNYHQIIIIFTLLTNFPFVQILTLNYSACLYIFVMHTYGYSKCYDYMLC